MLTGPLVPCLWFADQAEAAAAFYTQTFPAGRVLATTHYPTSFDNPGGRPRGSVLTVEFEAGGLRFTGLNGGPNFVPNPSVSFFVHATDAAEADALFGALADGGKVLMPIGAWPWSERYGWVQDRFGVSWQVIAGRPSSSGAKLVPCLMFANARHGRAEEAIRRLTGLFAGSRIESLERYAAGEGPEGSLKHGRFELSGQPFVAMDSHVAHAFDFDEGLSFQVMCADQAAIDEAWSALCDGGRPGPCGWLHDRFGISWQVSSPIFERWLTSPDVAARDRIFAALLEMGRLEIAALERAFEGA